MKLISAFLVFVTISASAFAEVQNNATSAQPPAAPVVNIPHSSRTKGNFSDIALDFMLTKLFEKQKGVKITYDFLESSFSDKTVAFKNLTVTPERDSLKGVIRLGLVRLNLKDLLDFIDTGVMTVAQIDASNVKISLDFYDKGQKVRSYLAGADNVKIDQITQPLNTAETVVKENMLIFSTTQVKNGKLYIPQTKERFAAQSLIMKDFTVYLSGDKHISLKSANVDGKTATTIDEMKKLLMQ